MSCVKTRVALARLIQIKARIPGDEKLAAQSTLGIGHALGRKSYRVGRAGDVDVDCPAAGFHRRGSASTHRVSAVP